MKDRIIYGILVAVITILALYIGGYLLDAVLVFISACAAYEFVKVRKEKFNILLFVLMFISILSIIYLHKYSTFICLILLAICLAWSVFDENESFTEMGALFLITVLIGFAFYFIRHIQHINKWMIGYIFVITYITDVFAYFIGRAYGKHKLLERISPKKTIEGSIGGWIFGCVLSLLWAKFFNFFGYPSFIFIISSLILPIISQIGDLVFSMIKRYYGVKDFSNLIKGHGGILDRLDSNIFCTIIFGALLLIL